MISAVKGSLLVTLAMNATSTPASSLRLHSRGETGEKPQEARKRGSTAILNDVTTLYGGVLNSRYNTLRGEKEPKRRKTLKDFAGQGNRNSFGMFGRDSYGRWTERQHKLFLEHFNESFVPGSNKPDWEKVAAHIPERNRGQVRRHAEEYFEMLNCLYPSSRQAQHDQRMPQQMPQQHFETGNQAWQQNFEQENQGINGNSPNGVLHMMGHHQIQNLQQGVAHEQPMQQQMQQQLPQQQLPPQQQMGHGQDDGVFQRDLRGFNVPSDHPFWGVNGPFAPLAQAAAEAAEAYVA